MRDLLRAMLALLDASEGLEEKAETRIEQERPKASAPVSAPAPRTAARADGLRWDEQDQPELAQVLEQLRDQHSKRDGARAWQDSRRVEPSWCMRAYSHSILRLLRGPEQGRRVKDAWGLYLSTVAALVGAGGDPKRVGPGLSLEHVACWPDAAEGFAHAREELARSLETRKLSAVRAGLGLPVADGAPSVSRLVEARRAGAKLIGLPARIGEDVALLLGKG